MVPFDEASCEVTGNILPYFTNAWILQEPICFRKDTHETPRPMLLITGHLSWWRAGTEACIGNHITRDIRASAKLIAHAIAITTGAPSYRQLSRADVVRPDVGGDAAAETASPTYVWIELFRVGARARVLRVPEPDADAAVDFVAGVSVNAGYVLAVAKDLCVGGLVDG